MLSEQQPQRRRSVQLNVRLEPELRERLRALAEADGRTETWFVERALELIVAEPELTPQAVAELRAQMVAAQAEATEARATAAREIERAHTRMLQERERLLRERQAERGQRRSWRVIGDK